MRRLNVRVLIALSLLLPGAAQAADRRVMVTSFDRIRVEGPYQVTVAVGRGSGAMLSGETRQIERTEVRVDGTTLVVRPAPDDAGGMPANPGAPVRVTLTTLSLKAATLLGGGALVVTGGGRVPRLDLSVAGTGSIGWTGIDTEQASAIVIGNGAVTLAGRAGTVRLTVNGAGRIVADALDAREVTVRVDGPGETTARARCTATVTNTGLGRVAIAGTPKCLVNSAAGGPVTCGAGATR